MKYPKVKGHWNYCFIFSDGMFYIGESGKKYCSHRWQPTQYKYTVVQPYIERDGWENIRKVVLCDGLTKEQALQLEDLLIQEARKGGWCINKLCSGNIYIENTKKYMKQYYTNHKEKMSTQKKQKYQSNKEQIIEKQKEYCKKRNSTPEGKIYYRVQTFNRDNPDKAIETGLEARQKYLETGYIPTYIKNNDLN